MLMDAEDEYGLPPPEVPIQDDSIYPMFVQPIPLQNDDELQAVIDGLARVRE